MQCGTAHVSDLWHIVRGTVLFMFLISSHFCKEIFCILENKESLSIYSCGVGAKEGVEIHVKVFNGNCIYLCME
jgi:hypothetical protein